MAQKWSTRSELYRGSSVFSAPYTDAHSKTDYLSLADPKALQYVLHKSGYHYPKGREIRQTIKLILGQGILWVDGPQIFYGFVASIALKHTSQARRINARGRS